MKMTKPTRQAWPAVARAWDEYGHAISFDDLIDHRVGSHGYVVLAWRERDGSISWADLSLVEGTWDRGTWEFQNDLGDMITVAQWKAARVRPECDYLDYPG